MLEQEQRLQDAVEIIVQNHIDRVAEAADLQEIPMPAIIKANTIIQSTELALEFHFGEVTTLTKEMKEVIEFIKKETFDILKGQEVPEPTQLIDSLVNKRITLMPYWSPSVKTQMMIEQFEALPAVDEESQKVIDQVVKDLKNKRVR